MSLGAIEAPHLAHPAIASAFFTREGGVSVGLYASLNGGVGSRDDPAAVTQNRARMAAYLGVAADRLLTPYQVHSAQAAIVEAAWAPEERPRVDGLVTRTPGLALGVSGADCGVVLFSEPEAGVIGAAHAGWKGALTGVLEATVDAMQALGARASRIRAALGPTIGPLSYEVGPEFTARFIAASDAYRAFFTPSPRAGHAMFDLPAFIIMRLHAAGVGDARNLALDTYADDQRFFSYRRAVHRGEADYGRLIAAIVLR